MMIRPQKPSNPEQVDQPIDILAVALPEDVFELDLERFRFLLSYPMWNHVCQLVEAGRDYQQGLSGARRLLALTHQFRAQLGGKELNRHLELLYSFTLWVLDELDMWEDYLVLWDETWRNRDLTMTYGNGLGGETPEEVHGADFQASILKRERGIVHVHFLWSKLKRKREMEIGLQLRAVGKDVTRLLRSSHRRVLSPERLQHRVDVVLRRIRILHGRTKRA